MNMTLLTLHYTGEAQHETYYMNDLSLLNTMIRRLKGTETMTVKLKGITASGEIRKLREVLYCDIKKYSDSVKGENIYSKMAV